MNPFFFRHPASWMAAAAGLALFPCLAASPSGSADSSDRLDRAACMDAGSSQARSSCLRETGAVCDEVRRGLTARSETGETLARNAQQRCARLPPEIQPICERMVQGEGSSSGSVAGGGVLRERVTELPAPTPRPKPPAPAQ